MKFKNVLNISTLVAFALLYVGLVLPTLISANSTLAVALGFISIPFAVFVFYEWAKKINFVKLLKDLTNV